MEAITNFFIAGLQSPVFLALSLIASSSIKIIYVKKLLSIYLRSVHILYPLIFLFTAVVSAFFCDLAWFIKLLRMVIPTISYPTVIFFIRLAWAALIVQYAALSLFLESLTQPIFHFKKRHIPIAIGTFTIAGYFLFLAFFRSFEMINEITRSQINKDGQTLEFFLMRYCVVYVVSYYIISSFLNVYQNINNNQIPKILRKQIRFFLYFLIIPYFAIEICLGVLIDKLNNIYFIIGFSTLLLAAAIHYCLRNVLRFRFLNNSSRVQKKLDPDVITHFRTTLTQLSNAKSIEEPAHIAQSFFKENFQIDPQKIHLSIKNINQTHSEAKDSIERKIDHFIAEQFNNPEKMINAMFVYDEIAFDQFYEKTDENSVLLKLLDAINADIFLPIYSKKHIVGYIIIERGSRPECFSHAEQDAMVAFASYLGNIINLIQNKNLDVLVSTEKKLKDQIFIKHQEINHYKESIQSFLRKSKEKALGIVIFKHGKFSPANYDAEKIIPIDLNIQEGHPISKICREVAHYVLMYKGQYSNYTYDPNGKPLLISGIPHLKEEQSVIITVSYPKITDVIMQQMHLLQNPNDWHYLLYLSSTNAGKLINNFIPSSTEIAVNIKINLLKVALSRRATLLDAPEKDCYKIVELVHTINMREQLHTIALGQQYYSPDITVALCGDTILNMQNQPLLEKLHNGTLFIKNMHFLDRTSQKHIAEYIKYGMYRPYNSNHRKESNVRILCSSNQPISQLAHEGKIISPLLSLLKNDSLQISSLLTFPAQEIIHLIDGYMHKIISHHAMKNLLALNEKEKEKIIETRPSSFIELQNTVERAIFKKTENKFTSEVNNTFSGFYDKDLQEAARLGKQALRHPNIMKKLWAKFKNQNKIALFLGVNRSSVNRRIKLYAIDSQTEGLA